MSIHDRFNYGLASNTYVVTGRSPCRARARRALHRSPNGAPPEGGAQRPFGCWSPAVKPHTGSLWGLTASGDRACGQRGERSEPASVVTFSQLKIRFIRAEPSCLQEGKPNLRRWPSRCFSENKYFF